MGALYKGLIVAGVISAISFYPVINNFATQLGMNTLNLYFASLVGLLVAGLIFGYYLDDVRRETPTKSAKYFAWVTSILVLAVIVSAFVVVGSPNSARLIQFDQQKVYDLQNIQSQIVNYWQKKGFLPNSLSDLNDPISSFMVPVDSQTKNNYEYVMKDEVNLSFELCATFNKPSQKNTMATIYPVGRGIDQNWDHNSGRVCFERTIDKQLYPPLNTVK